MNAHEFHTLVRYAHERHTLLVRRVAARLADKLPSANPATQLRLIDDATADIAASRDQVARDVAHIERIRARDTIKAPAVLALEPLSPYRPDGIVTVDARRVAFS